ncbi:MAG TPA: dTDP-4-dehydrorhamnose 3,5-epimerase [Flavobacteriaceae bacterium]|nr:dTDP-4-dehydrorhamnose 3,5-epimerase [Flavobacteriaceae bacterium]
MQFEKLAIPDVVLCKPNVFADDRGYFVETFHQKKLEEFIGKSLNFCQDNEAKSTKNVLRGLHYQLPPHAQSKLVRVVKGSVLDVVVDVRKNSPTYGKHLTVELNDIDKHQLFIPKGFAHGYLVLSNEVIFAYKVDAYYNPKSEAGILYNDPQLDINWQVNENDLIISEKDKIQSLLKNAKYL